MVVVMDPEPRQLGFITLIYNFPHNEISELVMSQKWQPKNKKLNSQSLQDIS